MENSEIRLGRRYAIRTDAGVEEAALVRPERGGWVAVRALRPDEYETPTERTVWVAPDDIIAPWVAYSVEDAHEAAIYEDQNRTAQAEYDALWERRIAHREPLIDVFRGITVPATAVNASADLPDVDLGEWLHETFVENRSGGALVTFDVFDALAVHLLALREAALNAAGGWGGIAVDTGIAQVETPKPTENIAGIQRFAQGD